jgi:predicted transcriptional regulator
LQTCGTLARLLQRKRKEKIRWKTELLPSWSALCLLLWHTTSVPAVGMVVLSHLTKESEMKTQLAPGTRNLKRERRIIKLHNAGRTQNEICKLLGITGGTVSYYLAKLGLTKKQKHSKASEDHLAHMKAHVKAYQEFVGTKKHKTDIYDDLIGGQNGKRTSNETEDLQVHIAYAFGKTETFLEHYADSAGLPRSPFAHGVATLLLRKTSGKVLGTKNRVSVL